MPEIPLETPSTGDTAFLRFYREQISRADVKASLRRQGFTAERFGVYRRFLFCYLNQIHDTFLGDDVVRRLEDRYSHHVWCFLKASEQVMDTRHIFLDNQQLLEYFWAHYEPMVESEREVCLQYFADFFHPSSIQTAADLASFNDLYDIFSKTRVAGRTLITA